jgi:hypothetical protein
MSKVQREDTMFVQDARLEARVRNLEQFMNQQIGFKPHFSMAQTANQSIPNITVTVIDFTSVLHEFGASPAMCDVSANTVTVRRAGLWHCGFKIMFNPDPDGMRMGAITINDPDPPGSIWWAQERIPGHASSHTVVNGSEDLRLAVGDVLRCVGYHEAGAALSTFTGGNDLNTFWGHWVSD